MTPYYADPYVTLYLADWRDVPPEQLAADVLVADPPYGVGWSGTSEHGRIDPRTGRRHGGKRHAVGATVRGDHEPFDPAPLLALGLPSILWGGNHYADRLPASPSWLVWDKRDGGRFGPDQADCELAWTNLGGPARLFRLVWSGGGSLRRENAIRRPAGRAMALHPTQKPVDLMCWCLQHPRLPAGTVLDPFAGSGSTLVAAKSLGRRAIGVEVEERHAEVAANRCSQEVLGLVAG